MTRYIHVHTFTIYIVFLYLSVSIALLSSHSRSFSEAPRPQQLTLCRSLHDEALPLQATVSEGLAQGPYVAARAGFEPTTLQSKGFNSTIAPPRPTT